RRSGATGPTELRGWIPRPARPQSPGGFPGRTLDVLNLSKEVEMRRDSSGLAFLIAGCLLVPMAASGQIGATTETAAMLSSRTLPPEGRRAMQDRIDAAHTPFPWSHVGLC